MSSTRSHAPSQISPICPSTRHRWVWCPGRDQQGEAVLSTRSDGCYYVTPVTPIGIAEAVEYIFKRAIELKAAGPIAWNNQFKKESKKNPAWRNPDRGEIMVWQITLMLSCKLSFKPDSFPPVFAKADDNIQSISTALHGFQRQLFRHPSSIQYVYNIWPSPSDALQSNRFGPPSSE